MIEEPTWRQLAQRMVREQLRARGIGDEAVLAAMARVPRHRFIPNEQHIEPAMAYDDRALPIGLGQTISQPYVVAMMTSELQVRPGQKVLEVGTGCGYQAAVLATLGAEVVTIERHEGLARWAAAALRELGHGEKVRVIVGDGTLGYPAEAPFDRIIITAGAPALPHALVAQLAPGGRIVAPIGDRRNQRLIVYQEHEGRLIESQGLPCRFVPLIGEQGWEGQESTDSGTE